MDLDPQLWHTHKRLLLITYGIIGLLALIGMVMNVKTVPVNDELRQTRQKIQIVHEDNERKRLGLAKILTLRAVEERATTELGMTYPDSVFYIDHQGHQLDKDGHIVTSEEKEASPVGQ